MYGGREEEYSSSKMEFPTQIICLPFLSKGDSGAFRQCLHFVSRIDYNTVFRIVRVFGCAV